MTEESRKRMCRTIECYLIIDARGDVRVRKSHSGQSPTEIAVKVSLKLPTPPRIAAVLDIELPEPPEVNVDFMVGEWGELDAGEG